MLLAKVGMVYYNNFRNAERRITMQRHLCIGSQLFVNGTESEEDLRVLVHKMHHAGLSLIRLFMTRDLLEKAPDQWDFSLFDAIFDQAQALQMGVVPTLMAETAPGWMHLTSSAQDAYDLDDSALWTSGLSYVDTVVQRYANHKALHSWVLWNEPSRSITLQPSNMGLYRTFLQQKYPTIRQYNEKHYRTFQSFEDLEENFLSARSSVVFQSYADKTDLLDFTVQNLCQKLTDLKSHVRLWDCTHPVHINPHDIAGESYTNGQNFFEEGKCVDFLGCSAHPSWHSTDFPKNRIPLSIAFFADVMRAAGEGERFWVTELQGGTNLFSGKTYLCPDARDIALYLASSFATGAEAVLFWCFNTRISGFEGGEWGLLNQLGESSERLQAASEFAALIRTHQDLFDASTPSDPDVYILYSDNTIRLQMLETIFRSSDGIRNKNNGKFSLIGAYEAATDLGFHPGFISEEQLLTHPLPKDSTLLLPDTYCLAEDTLRILTDFVSAGGTVIADGLIGMKTPDGILSPDTLEKAAALFGASVEDIVACDETFPIQNDSTVCPGEFFKVRFRTNGGTVSGNTLHHSLGLGHAIRIPGILFRRYFRREDPEILDYLRPLFPARKNAVLQTPQPHLMLKTLHSGQTDIHFVLNTNREPVDAEICGNSSLRLLTSHTPCNRNGKLILPLKARDFAVFTTSAVSES